MINTLKIRKNQGEQAIPDVTRAEIRPPFRGLPAVDGSKCGRCDACREVCPVGAISARPLAIDLGKCVFCGDCARECPEKSITFSTFHKIASTSRDYLVVDGAKNAEEYLSGAIEARQEIKRLFGASFKLRQVSAAGCNGCEWELNACGNPNFDMGRFGIEFVASPRHADGILITGPISENMAPALEDAYMCTPDPKVVILAGSCAISGGVFQGSAALNREFLDKHHIDLYIPGCPVHPLTVVNGLLKFMGR
ncbi:MAG: 4Fe-4S dicluster domain-containing protein [Spirochaetes bacterium]|nr:MAG: 4Fe-4S dicluster domain-containing protein [Spirochaetota bacterium]